MGASSAVRARLVGAAMVDRASGGRGARDEQVLELATGERHQRPQERWLRGFAGVRGRPSGLRPVQHAVHDVDDRGDEVRLRGRCRGVDSRAATLGDTVIGVVAASVLASANTATFFGFVGGTPGSSAFAVVFSVVTFSVAVFSVAVFDGGRVVSEGLDGVDGVSSAGSPGSSASGSGSPSASGPSLSQGRCLRPGLSRCRDPPRCRGRRRPRRPVVSSGSTASLSSSSSGSGSASGSGASSAVSALSVVSLSEVADVDDFDGVESVSSAQATPCPVKTADPTPNATARPPTRPTYAAAPMKPLSPAV